MARSFVFCFVLLLYRAKEKHFQLEKEIKKGEDTFLTISTKIFFRFKYTRKKISTKFGILRYSALVSLFAHC